MVIPELWSRWAHWAGEESPENYGVSKLDKVLRWAPPGKHSHWRLYSELPRGMPRLPSFGIRDPDSLHLDEKKGGGKHREFKWYERADFAIYSTEHDTALASV